MGTPKAAMAVAAAATCSAPNGVCDSTTGKCKCKAGFVGIDCSKDVNALPPLAREVYKWNKGKYKTYQEWVEKIIREHGPFGVMGAQPFAKDVSEDKKEVDKEHEVAAYDKIMAAHKKLGTPLYTP